MSLIIEFEGIDGSGKTTALNFCAQYLKSQGYRVLATNDNGNRYLPACVQLRNIILNPEYKFTGISMELIFAAMRVENTIFNDSIKDQYDFILYDRGWLSHLAYAAANTYPQFPTQFYEHFILQYTHLPNSIIFLDASVDIASQRRLNRDKKADVIELRGNEFQQKVQQYFFEYIQQYKTNTAIYFIDANQEFENVQLQLKKVFDEQINPL